MDEFSICECYPDRVIKGSSKIEMVSYQVILFISNPLITGSTLNAYYDQRALTIRHVSCQWFLSGLAFVGLSNALLDIKAALFLL